MLIEARPATPMLGRPRSVGDDQVFAAIGTVITAHGPAGLTFARLAAEVGLTASALAQRFGSKRELLLAYAAQGSGFVGEAFSAARARHRSAIDALPHALAGLSSAIVSRDGLAHNLAFLQLDLVDEELRRHAVAQSRLVRRQLAALVQEAIAEGDVRHHRPAELAALLYAVYAGALLTWAIDGTGSLDRWIVRRVRQVLQPFRSGEG